MHRPFRFAPPPGGPTAVLRPRLLTELAKRFDARLVTIEAGAGLGKTTLLTQAVHENRLAGKGRDCWLTCEPADSSASTLLGALLQVTAATDGDTDVPSVERVCEAVWAATPEHVCLVLDDAHHLEPGSSGERALTELLEQLPENGHLVVAGRRLPALPTTRLVLHHRAVQLSEGDLRLDEREETALAALHGIGPDVISAAGGWPALAELYARTGQVHAERFVWEEVISLLPDRECEAFLLLVAVGGADADVLEAVAGGPFDAHLVGELPMVAADERGGLRPHQLWADLLQQRIDGEAATAARRRLADALLARGDNGGAFELLAATGDWDAALPALFEATNDQRRPPYADELDRWRHLVPPSHEHAPEVVYLEAMIHRAGDAWSEEATTSFRHAAEAFRARGDIVREITATVRWSHLAWLIGDRVTLDAMYERGNALATAGVPLGPILVMNRAVVADLDGRTDEVLDRTAEVDDLEPRLRHFKPLLKAWARLAAGDAGAATDDATAAADAALPVMPAAGTAWAALAPALVAWARGDLTAIRQDPPADPGSRYHLSERVPALALAAVVAAHLGDAVTAAGLRDQIDALVPELGERHSLAGFRAVAGAAAAIAGGDEDGARNELRRALDGRPLDPAGAGRALAWLPSLPYLLDDASRAHIDALPEGPSRQRTLTACRTLLAARSGRTHAPAGLLEDPGALLTALPITLAVELVVRTAVDTWSGAHEACVNALAALAPAAVRDTIRGLAGDDDPDVRVAARSMLAAVPIPPPGAVRIEVLGPARLLRDGVVVDDPGWRRQRVRQLVCALVAHPEIRRARLAALLWPDLDDKAVSGNLRITLTYLQQLLEPHRARGDAPWFLRQESGLLRLRADEHCSVDAWEFDAALAAADAAAGAGTPSVELEHLTRAVALWRGDYLDDVAGEDWAEPLRERARARLVRAALRAGDLLVAARRFDEAAAQADVALGADPWCEPAIRLRVSSLLAGGDEVGARQAYDAGVRALAELGVMPEPATEELAGRLRERAG